MGFVGRPTYRNKRVRGLLVIFMKRKGYFRELKRSMLPFQ